MEDEGQQLYPQEPNLISKVFPFAAFAILTIVLIVALYILFGM